MRLRVVRHRTSSIDHELIWGWLLLGALTASLAWVKLAGTPPAYCPMRTVTGLPCLACGSTRSFVALVNGKVAESFRLNPLAFATYVLSAAYAPYALACVYLRWPRVRIRLSRRDWAWIRWVVSMFAVVLWAFLFLDGR
jgi:hypothetical protein